MQIQPCFSFLQKLVGRNIFWREFTHKRGQLFHEAGNTTVSLSFGRRRSLLPRRIRAHVLDELLYSLPLITISVCNHLDAFRQFL